MQGIEIINTIPVYTTYWHTGMLWGLWVGAGLSLGLVLYYAIKKSIIMDAALDFICVSIIMIMIFMGFGAVVGENFEKDFVETWYEIRIPDGADFDAITEKYELIEQGENSWIVKERTNED